MRPSSRQPLTPEKIEAVKDRLREVVEWRRAVPIYEIARDALAVIEAIEKEWDAVSARLSELEADAHPTAGEP